MKQTILLVEDNPSIVKINERTLELEGYRALTAVSLEEAHKLIQKQAVDLIVLDIMLPDGSGLDFCQQIRGESIVPILFLTALEEKETMLQALKNGGDDYLSKPYDLEEFSMRIHTLLRRIEMEHQNKQIRHGALTLDTMSGRAYMDGIDTGLTVKEFGVLHYLAARRNRICSTEEIYESVWGLPLNENPNAVRTHISTIRRKLELEKHPDIVITNLFRKGYKFIIRSEIDE